MWAIRNHYIVEIKPKNWGKIVWLHEIRDKRLYIYIYIYLFIYNFTCCLIGIILRNISL